MQEPGPQLINAAKAGDSRAFEKLVRAFQTDVYRLALHIVRDRGRAEDAAQETFIRAFRFLRRYRGDSKFSTWLLSIARNCALDELRRGARGGQPTEDVARDVPARGDDAQAGLEIKEAIDALSIELREAVILIDMFGLSYRETAEIVRVAEGTIKSRVHRARGLLIERLKPMSEEKQREG